MKTMCLVLLVALTSGCHAKFKKHVGSLDAVQLQIITQAGPSVSLGQAYVVEGEDETANAIAGLAAGVFNVVQAVKGEDVRRRLQEVVDLDRTNSAMNAGVAQTLGGGPPFSIGDSRTTGDLLQLEVIDWGLEVPNVGAQGAFNYTVKARIYKEDGERIYSSRLNCEVGAGSPGVASEVLMLVNNVKQVKEMSDEELQASFDAMASYCGGVFVSMMRRHAG